MELAEVVKQAKFQLEEWLDARTNAQSDAIFQWLITDSAHQDGSVLMAEQCKNILEKRTVLLEGITFSPPSNCDSEPSTAELLQKFKHVRFVECVFECDELELPGVTQWYSRCEFRKGWKVWCKEIDPSLIKEDDEQFVECSFHGTVVLDGNRVAADSLRHYAAVFFDCTAPKLLVYRAEVPCLLWRGVWLPSPDRGGINELNIAWSDLRESLNLEHLAVKEVELIASSFVGLTLQGLRSTQLFMKSCRCTETVDMELVKIDKLTLIDCTFLRPVDLSYGEVESLNILRSDFAKVLDAAQLEVTWSLHLKSIRCDVPPNFNDLTLSPAAIRHSNRETFRLIKHGLELSANRIEANRYFALEMEAYRQDLKSQAESGRYFEVLWERLLLGMNSLISQHGQSYWRPLLWILYVAAVVALVIANGEQGWVILPAQASDFISKGVSLLNAWAGGIIIFNPLYANFPGREAFVLLVSILLSTFVWHFLIAVRRHSRR